MESDRINGFGMRLHLSAGDWSAAALVAGAVLLLLIIRPLPIAHPCMWEHLGVAAALRAPNAEFPGLAPFFARLFFEHFSVGAGYAAFLFFGHALAAVTAGLWYLVFRQLLEFTCRIDMADRLWNEKLCPFFAGMGAVCLAFSEPIWVMAQTFSPVGLDLFLSALACVLLLRFIARGRRHLGFLAMFVLGVVSAETPFGVALLMPLGVLFVLAWRVIDSTDDGAGVLCLPPLEEFPWMLIVAGWVTGLAVTIALVDSSFRALGGDPGSFHAAFAAWKSLALSGTTLKGAVLGALTCWLPLGALVLLCPWMTPPSPSKPWLLRALVLVLTLVGASQVVGPEAWRFRAWTGEEQIVAVSLFPGLCQSAAAATMVLGAAAFAAMGWCHENRLPLWLVKVLRLLLVALALALMVRSAGMCQCDELRAKLAKIHEHVKTTLASSKGEDEILSQGSLDVLLEFFGRLESRNVKIVDEK